MASSMQIKSDINLVGMWKHEHRGPDVENNDVIRTIDAKLDRLRLLGLFNGANRSYSRRLGL